MKRNAISQWELSDDFWAESDPPEPCATGRSFLQKCARQLDRLTTDKRVKYRLAGRRRDTLPPEAPRPYRVRRPPPVDQEYHGYTGRIDENFRRRTSNINYNNNNYYNENKTVYVPGGGGDDDCCTESLLSPLQQPPPQPLCVIKRSDDYAGAASGTKTFGTVPFREVSTKDVGSTVVMMTVVVGVRRREGNAFAPCVHVIPNSSRPGRLNGSRSAK